MSRLIGPGPRPSPPVITLASRCSVGGAISRIGVGAAASGASPWSDASDVLLAFPFVIEAQTLVNKFFWVNGSSAGGQSDVALFDEAFNKIGTSTGAVVGSGNNVPQATAPSGGAFTIPPGLYYCGITHGTTTTNQFFRWSIGTTGAAFWQSLGCFRQASVSPGAIGSSATPGDMTNVAFPVYGIITRTVFDA